MNDEQENNQDEDQNNIENINNEESNGLLHLQTQLQEKNYLDDLEEYYKDKTNTNND